ncbi:MAG: hypothetical protein Q7N87_02640 [Candidatus Uhrbacteria bacterium]|nr:hypothetical protein [Candidatus Uhrbacteria bacterium]
MKEKPTERSPADGKPKQSMSALKKAAYFSAGLHAAMLGGLHKDKVQEVASGSTAVIRRLAKRVGKKGLQGLSKAFLGEAFGGSAALAERKKDPVGQRYEDLLNDPVIQPYDVYKSFLLDAAEEIGGATEAERKESAEYLDAVERKIETVSSLRMKMHEAWQEIDGTYEAHHTLLTDIAKKRPEDRRGNCEARALFGLAVLAKDELVHETRLQTMMVKNAKTGEAIPHMRLLVEGRDENGRKTWYAFEPGIPEVRAEDLDGTVIFSAVELIHTLARKEYEIEARVTSSDEVGQPAASSRFTMTDSIFPLRYPPGIRPNKIKKEIARQAPIEISIQPFKHDVLVPGASKKKEEEKKEPPKKYVISSAEALNARITGKLSISPTIDTPIVPIDFAPVRDVFLREVDLDRLVIDLNDHALRHLKKLRLFDCVRSRLFEHVRFPEMEEFSEWNGRGFNPENLMDSGYFDPHGPLSAMPKLKKAEFV